MGQSVTSKENLELTLLGIVCRELGLSADNLSATTELQQLAGVESIKMLRIIAKAERLYGIELDDQVVFRVRTISELAEAVQLQIMAESK